MSAHSKNSYTIMSYLLEYAIYSGKKTQGTKINVIKVGFLLFSDF